MIRRRHPNSAQTCRPTWSAWSCARWRRTQPIATKTQARLPATWRRANRQAIGPANTPPTGGTRWGSRRLWGRRIVYMAKDSRKKELLKAWKDQERQKLIASIPIPHSDLRDLFDLLDRENAPKKCDRTLR